MGFETIGYDASEGVATITFARPEQLNAYTEQMSGELRAVLDEIAADEAVRVLVLRGMGEQFMVGADIGMLERWSHMDSGALREVLLAGFSPSMLERLPQPVIAAIDGYAFGIGCEIALACDLRIATDRAAVALPEITLGLFPGAGGTQRLPRLVGRPRAAEMVFTGRRLGASEATEWGLVNRVVEPDTLDKEVAKLADKLVRLSPLALRHAKRAVVNSEEMGQADGIDDELARFVGMLGSQDTGEGTRAFLEKRSPSFKGK